MLACRSRRRQETPWRQKVRCRVLLSEAAAWHSAAVALWRLRPIRSSQCRAMLLHLALSTALCCASCLPTAAGSISSNFEAQHDYRGRPRSVTSDGGVVAADHGRCSDIGRWAG